MSDDSDIWKDMRKEGQLRKKLNLERSLKILHKEGIEFSMLTDYQVRIGDYDFWPSTGLFLNRVTQKKGRGVFTLLKILKS